MIWLKIVMSSEIFSELDVVWDYACEAGLVYQRALSTRKREVYVPLKLRGPRERVVDLRDYPREDRGPFAHSRRILYEIYETTP
jgi:hypothetical protein